MHRKEPGYEAILGAHPLLFAAMRPNTSFYGFSLHIFSGFKLGGQTAMSKEMED